MDYLLSECRKINSEDFAGIELKSLTDYGVAVRYPDDFINPLLEEAKYYSQVAFEIRKIIYKLVRL